MLPNMGDDPETLAIASSNDKPLKLFPFGSLWDGNAFLNSAKGCDQVKAAEEAPAQMRLGRQLVQSLG